MTTVRTFVQDTAVRGPDNGRYRGEIQPGWDIGGNANGGYMLAIATRAMIDASGRPDPVTVTAHYLRPGGVGPVGVDTEVVKSGKRFATVRANLISLAGDTERPLMSIIGTFGDLDSSVHNDPELVTAAPPELPPFAECTHRMGGSGDTVAPDFSRRVDLRLHPDDSFLDGRKSGKASLRGWFTFPELGTEGTLDPVGLIQATDAFPPTIFNVDLPVAWVPTVELTSHVRARPAPGPLRCVFTTRFVTGGFLEEDGEVWDSTGRLVAQSRQLALLPRSV